MATISDLIVMDDVSNYKAPVGGLGADMQQAITTIIPLAIGYIEARLGFTIKETAYSKFVVARSKVLVALPAYPVDPSKITFSVDGTAWPLLSNSSLITSTGDAWLDYEWGLVHYMDSTTLGTRPYSSSLYFPTGFGRIFCAFTAGWGGAYDYPQALKTAAIVLTMLMYEERNRIGIKAKTIGPETISEYIRDSSDYKTMCETAIQKYSRYL